MKSPNKHNKGRQARREGVLHRLSVQDNSFLGPKPETKDKHAEILATIESLKTKWNL